MRVGGFVFASALLTALPLSAAQYVDSPPLSQTVGTSVTSCQATESAKILPLITWGGDIRTIYGNGNSRDTVPGSIFADEGLQLTLKREDVFEKQVEAYLRCESPYLRGTLVMLNMAAEVANKDPRSEIVVVYQMTWSAGGDAFVVKAGIKRPEDLKGKTIILQRYGPHVDYLAKVLADAGLSLSDVTIKWTENLVGFGENTPGGSFRDDPSVAAAFVIIPDALALTSGGTVGTGAEDSVSGATILLSTKTADHVIGDFYAVRRDYLESHRGEVEKFVHALMRAEEAMKNLVANKSSRQAEYHQMMSASADILLDSPQAIADTEGLYADAKSVGWKGNVKFFTDPNYPRNFEALTHEIQAALISLGMLSAEVPLAHARWDYNVLAEGLQDTSGVEAPRFDSAAVTRVVTEKQRQGALSEGELFSFEVSFQPNQRDFSADLYAREFDKVIELASTYGGAIITVEGHSDPLEYLRTKKAGETTVVLKRTEQSAKNLSYSRANAVRDAVVAYADSRGITLDSSQFATVGHGIWQPKTGMCGADPCAPKTEAEWLANMRVEFRIIQVEAEADVFRPL